MTLRLSIVISTMNRATFIGETLESILPQMSQQTEVVVLDGASTDGAPAVLQNFAARHPALKVVLAPVNSGLDADYDAAVGHARGDYVWLMGDDDLLKPGAVARVIQALAHAPDLLVVDAEDRDITMTRVLEPRRLPFSGERAYAPEDGDRLLADAGNALSFIGGTIVRRALWMERDRARYYGSMFLHVGVIFQAPLSAIVLGEPLIAIRYGNASWSGRSFDIWMRLWPDLIWGLPLSDWAKRAVVPRHPWRSLRRLVAFRGAGAFDRSQYRAFFAGRRLGAWRAVLLALAGIPGAAVNTAALLHLRAKGHARGSGGYNLAWASPYANRLSRWIAGF